MSEHTSNTSRALRVAALVLAAGAVAACTPSRPANQPPVTIKGTNPNGGAQTGANTLNNQVIQGADEKGIITYDGYQSAIARDGDTVSTVAERIGLSATQLGAYNGLPATHQLRAGDELVLPPRPGGYGDAGPQASVITPSQPPQRPASASTIQQTELGGTEVASDGSLVQTAPPQQQAEATAPGSTVSQQQASNGPAETWSPELAAAAIERSTGIRDDGSLGAPPSSGNPVPPEPAPRRELQSPDLGQYQTEEDPNANAPDPQETAAQETQVAASDASPANTGLNIRMQKPVQGPVAVGYNKGTGPARNDGVDFAAPAGSPVVAAADGEVALISPSLGGLGTIVMMRHPNDLLTVYGRIDGITVSKGDIIQKGQQIGVVSDAAAPAEPRMHFEVRRGSTSLDPMQFL
jgi:murein DD-endopeptidase MepM/ murein hydrolase activator NlpD